MIATAEPTTKTWMLSANAKHLATLAQKIAAQGDSRPTLNCVAFDLKHREARAADGFTCACVPLDTDQGNGFSDPPEQGTILIRVADIITAKKMTTGQDATIGLYQTGDGAYRLWCHSKNRSGPDDVRWLDVTPVDGTFPDLDQIIGRVDQDGAVTVALNAELLRHLCELVQSDPGTINDVMRLTILPGNIHPVRVDFNQSRALIMPMIVNDR